MILITIYQAFGPSVLPWLYWFAVVALFGMSVFRLCCSFTVEPTARWRAENVADYNVALRQFLGHVPTRSRHMLRLAMMGREFTGDDYEMLSQLDEGSDAFKGASQGEINRLPVQILLEKDASICAQRKEYCAVCLEAYITGDEVRSLPCLHRYHKHCIDLWLAQKAHCPVCKFDCVV